LSLLREHARARAIDLPLNFRDIIIENAVTFNVNEKKNFFPTDPPNEFPGFERVCGAQEYPGILFPSAAIYFARYPFAQFGAIEVLHSIRAIRP
jgi:hypothetical protein